MATNASVTICWFRRDLRLADHPALTAAAARGPVLALFVRDPAIEAVAGRNRLGYLHDALTDLHAATGARLVVRSGAPAEVVPAVAAEVGAELVTVTRDHSPRGSQRDAAVAASLAAVGARLEWFGSNHVVAPGTILTGGGTPYRVFTPFYRRWIEHEVPAPLGPPQVTWHEAPSDGLGARPDSAAEVMDGGEAAAHRRLDRCVAEVVEHYHETRDLPGVDGTSRLSADLKFGCLHPRQLIAVSGTGPGPEAFVRELAFRDFYADVVHHRPETVWDAVNAHMESLRRDTGADADTKFTAWAQGLTGYPIVDAGMRQLLATGWMHNRVRMITASFLVKDLHIDWRRGAAHFLEHLVDADVASNQQGWQWVAGCGTDASPFFRVFNPTTQSRKFDPDGAYIRRWVPELAELDSRSIHEPAAGAGGPLFDPTGYPPPMVDHAVERREALDRYDEVRAARGG